MTLEEKAKQELQKYKELPKWKGKVFMQDENTCFTDGYILGTKEALKMKVNTTTISDAPLMEREQLEVAKELIEDMVDQIPSSHSDYYKDVIERAR